MVDDGLYHGLDRCFDACRLEMARHLEKKGENWKRSSVVVEIGGPFGTKIKKTIPTPSFLEELFRAALNELLENPTNDQRIDLINIIAMQYLWDEGLVGE